MTKVAIQGTHGSYSEEAAMKLISGAKLLECEDFAETFKALDAGRVDYVVVPVANKIVGDIEGTAGYLRSGGFRELERASIPVRHVLAGAPGADLGRVEIVTSHVEALRQCRRYLKARPGWTQNIGTDTASSVRRIVEEGNIAAAAIGSRRAVEAYGAKILAEDISDDPDNWTTFCLLTR